MKIIILILLFVLLFGALLVYFNFGAIYTALSYVMQYLQHGLTAVIGLISGFIDIIESYSLVWLLVIFFVVLWFLHDIIVKIFGGKE